MCGSSRVYRCGWGMGVPVIPWFITNRYISVRNYRLIQHIVSGENYKLIIALCTHATYTWV